jgi:hypothetical protein
VQFKREAPALGTACSLMGGLSINLSASAAEAQRRDLEGMGRRADASRELRNTLIILKDRIAQRAAAAASVLPDSDNVVELVA